MDRVLEALTAAREGSVGVPLADGAEPGPVYFDVGSGSHMASSSEWHCYDGRFDRPRAAALRGSCACGWRGVAEYPLDWTLLDGDKPLYEADVDLSGPVDRDRRFNDADGRGLLLFSVRCWREVFGSVYLGSGVGKVDHYSAACGFHDDLADGVLGVVRLDGDGDAISD